jgi:hypothetical protein
LFQLALERRYLAFRDARQIRKLFERRRSAFNEKMPIRIGFVHQTHLLYPQTARGG